MIARYIIVYTTLHFHTVGTVFFSPSGHSLAKDKSVILLIKFKYK